MQTPMKRKVCPFDFFSSEPVSLCAVVALAALPGGKGRAAAEASTQAQAAGGWCEPPCSPLLLLFLFFFLHECVLPADEGDQDGSLYFLPSRCCFACVVSSRFFFCF